MALSDGGKQITGLPLARVGTWWRWRPRPPQLPFPCAGKPTCFTGQLRALVLPSAGVREGEGLRSLIAFYSHLPKGGIGLGPNKILLPPILLQDPAGQGSPRAALKFEPTPGLGCSGPSTRQRCHPLQLWHSANHSWFPMQGCPSLARRLATAGLHSALTGWHCFFSLRNANRPSCS